METKNILQADLLDIVFDGRNKQYGAYELRRSYQRRLVKAMAFTVGTGLFLAGVIAYKTATASKDPLAPKLIELTLADVEPLPPEPEPLPPPPPPPPPPVAPPIIETVQFTRIVLTDKDIVTPPPSQDQLTETRIGIINQEGIRSPDIVVPLSEADGGKGLLTQSVPVEKEVETFRKVEIPASYIGNWIRFLERNLSGEVAVDNGAAPGNNKVIIEFVVDIDGTVSQIKPLTKFGYGMEEEAMRVIRRSGKWKPAIQNGKEVKAYRKQPITFSVLSNG